jgi:hypothetical protein
LACVGDTTLIAGIFPAPIVYLLRELETQGKALAQAVRSGELPGQLVLTPEQRSYFGRLLGPRPDIAARLDRAASAPVEEKVAEAWPRLSLVYCWTTATAAAYLPELHRRLGPRVAVRDAIYSACEGWCSIPMGEELSGGALAVTSHVFEFFDEEDEGLARAPRWVHELEEGRRYQIVVTTGSGLYRYLLGDLVEVCGRYERTPRIRFVRKMGAFSNLAGEKLEEAHVTQAVNAALASAATAPFFALAPDRSGNVPGYALHVELPAGAGQSAEEVAARLDAELGKVSYDYGRLRLGGQLAPVRLKPLKPGAYEAFRQARVGDGSAEAQLKDVRLVDAEEKLPEGLRGKTAG